MKKPSRTNLVLGATCMALGLTVLAQTGGTSVLPVASAQPKSGEQTDTPFNAADQRKQIILQLDQVNRRLSKIEEKLSTGLSVKVTEMPDVRIRDGAVTR